MISSPAPPVTIWRLPDGDVLLLPALWPVRLTREQQRELAEELLDNVEGTA